MTYADRSRLDLDLLAASLRANDNDLNAFVESLAAKLEQAMPGRVAVERRRAGIFGPKAVRRIALQAGAERLELRAEGGTIETLCARVSGGIVLKTEPLDAEAWLAALGAAVAVEARRSETARQALERLLFQ